MPGLVKIFKWIVVVFVGLLAALIIGLYATGRDYIIKGVYVTYLQGHNTAYLDDYRFFTNHVVETESPQPWPVSESYNEVTVSPEILNRHDTLETVAYLIIHQDSIWHESYYRGYTDSSISNSFSMAKSVVAALLGKVIEDGQVEGLSQKVNQWVPELSGRYVDSLRLIDLVTMSSGMKWQEDYYDPFSITTQLYFDTDMVGILPKMPIESRPGQSFSYKSGDTQVLGIALQRATGNTLSALLSTYFWKPMGAEHAALWQVDSKENGIEKAYCCIASNARDFARFGKLYLQNGYWQGQPLLDSAYIAESLQAHFPDSPEYGYGWWLGEYRDRSYFYMDGHLGQYVIVVPEDDLIIVRLGHRTDDLPRSHPESAFQSFIRQAYRMLGNRVARNPELMQGVD
ncbi:MAG TPA: beta-lactamase family protein [Candidatus Sphingobacterium stercorigallinarum]|nr:beta-lactamase family protein [Candidatus Sphingobacterium stercorigallinarum]HLT88813.1 serine hydrolase [Sphingobacterium sp.]